MIDFLIIILWFIFIIILIPFAIIYLIYIGIYSLIAMLVIFIFGGKNGTIKKP